MELVSSVRRGVEERGWVGSEGLRGEEGPDGDWSL